MRKAAGLDDADPPRRMEAGGGQHRADEACEVEVAVEAPEAGGQGSTAAGAQQIGRAHV